MIREGFYVGRKAGENWFIDSSELSGSGISPSITRSTSTTAQGETNNVAITDIQMTFSSMIIFMVKWALASIPAVIILTIIFTIVTAIFGSIAVDIYGSRY